MYSAEQYREIESMFEAITALDSEILAGLQRIHDLCDDVACRSNTEVRP